MEDWDNLCMEDWDNLCMEGFGLHCSLAQAQMQDMLSNFVLYAAGNERILRTPLPTGYSR